MTARKQASKLDAGSLALTNVANPAAAQDAATKAYVDTADALKANLASPALTGTTTFGGDANLYRDAAGVLKTDSEFRIAGVALRVQHPNPLIAISGVDAANRENTFLFSQISGESNPQFNLAHTGKFNWGPGGSSALDTTIYRSDPGRLKTDGWLIVGTQLYSLGPVFSAEDISLALGKTLKIAEGSNAKMGTLTLNGSTPVVVSTTAVTANSRIFLTTNTPGGVPGFHWVSARTAATSFSVTGTVGDTSTVAWVIFEPA